MEYIVGLILNNLSFGQEFHRFCQSSLIYLLILGFGSVYRILVFQVTDVFSIVDDLLDAVITCDINMAWYQAEGNIAI